MSSSTTEVAEIRMPQMGVSVAEGTVVEWRKQVGDWVEADEVIAAISTDKIDTDVEAPAAGRLAEIVVDVGETVEVGTVLALIATDAKPGEAHTSEGTSEAEVALEAPGDAGELHGDTDREHANGSAQARRRAAPRGRPALLAGRACGWRRSTTSTSSQIEGTGRGGRVRKQDVLAFLESDGGGASAEPPDAHRVAVQARRARRRRSARRGSPARRAGERRGRSRGCASRSAARWSSRCRRRRPARRSSRRT